MVNLLSYVIRLQCWVSQEEKRNNTVFNKLLTEVEVNSGGYLPSHEVAR